MFRPFSDAFSAVSDYKTSQIQVASEYIRIYHFLNNKMKYTIYDIEQKYIEDKKS
jgi:hypothetical protein